MSPEPNSSIDLAQDQAPAVELPRRKATAIVGVPIAARHKRFPWERMLAADPTVRGAYWGVLAAVAQEVRSRTGLVEITASGIVARTGYGTRTVQRSLDAACRAGWLERLRKGHHTPGHDPVPSMYRITAPPTVDQSAHGASNNTPESAVNTPESAVNTPESAVNTPGWRTTHDSHDLQGSERNEDGLTPGSLEARQATPGAKWLSDLADALGEGFAALTVDDTLLDLAERRAERWSAEQVAQHHRRSKGAKAPKAPGPYLAKLLRDLPDDPADDPLLARAKATAKAKAKANDDDLTPEALVELVNEAWAAMEGLDVDAGKASGSSVDGWRLRLLIDRLDDLHWSDDDGPRPSALSPQERLDVATLAHEAIAWDNGSDMPAWARQRAVERREWAECELGGKVAAIRWDFAPEFDPVRSRLIDEGVINGDGDAVLAAIAQLDDDALAKAIAELAAAWRSKQERVSQEHAAEVRRHLLATARVSVANWRKVEAYPSVAEQLRSSLFAEGLIDDAGAPLLDKLDDLDDASLHRVNGFAETAVAQAKAEYEAGKRAAEEARVARESAYLAAEREAEAVGYGPGPRW